MKRMTGLMVVALLAAACGGDEETSPPATDASTIDDAATDDSEAADGTTDESTTDGAMTDGAMTDDTTTDGAMTDGAMTDGVITSFDQIPQECLDLTAEFLRTIEPLVSPIDWENGSMSDFESVAPAFEAEASAFDARSAEACASIDLADDGLSVMIDFAADEAPGTVDFLIFLDSLQNATLGIEPSTDDAPQAFETCAEAIVFIEELVNEYPTITDVPMVDMLQVANIGAIFMSCTPEEQEFFENPEVNAFFGE